MTLETFIGTIIGEMMADGFTLKFVRRSNESKNSSSYFTDKPNLELCVQSFEKHKSDEWMYDTIHEYGHYMQWKHDNKFWAKFDKDLYAMCDYFEEGKNTKLTKKNIRNVQYVESDCGLQVEKVIKKYKIKIDKKRYFQNFNLYILSHPAMVKYKIFDTPYHITENIMDYIPTHPITMEEVDNFPHYDKIEMCYKLAYDK